MRATREIEAVCVLAETPLVVFGIQPPYRDFTHLPKLDDGAVNRLTDGSVLAVKIACPTYDWLFLPDVVPALRARFPALPVILLVEQRGNEDVARLIGRAGKLNVRAVIAEGDRIRETLHPIFTQPVDLAGDVMEWIHLRGVFLSPMLSHLVREIVARAPRHSELGDLLAEIRVPETSTCSRFRKRGLPAPNRWHQIARALHAALRIQAEPEKSLLRIAGELGYSDHSALSQQIHRAFGVRPGVLRGMLGWEWLMER